MKKYLLLLLIGFTMPAWCQTETTRGQKEQFIPVIDNFYKQIAFDDVEGIKQALKNKDLSPNTLSKYGDAPLPYAIKEGSYKVLKYLLQLTDINVNLENRFGENALMMAALKGDLEWVQYLVETKDAEIDKDGWTALHYAASTGKLDVVGYLIANEADVNAESPNQMTPLMLAAKFGHIYVVRYLLDHEADLSVQTTSNQTAIDFAFLGNQREIADGLKSRWKKLYGKDYVISVN
jgi:hypothetical protein